MALLTGRSTRLLCFFFALLARASAAEDPAVEEPPPADDGIETPITNPKFVDADVDLPALLQAEALQRQHEQARIQEEELARAVLLEEQARWEIERTQEIRAMATDEDSLAFDGNEQRQEALEAAVAAEQAAQSVLEEARAHEQDLLGVVVDGDEDVSSESATTT